MPAILADVERVFREEHGRAVAVLVRAFHGLDLPGYDVFHAVRADLLRRLERPDEARAAYGRAIELARNPAERAFLERRRDGLG